MKRGFTMNKQASFVHGNSAWKRALSFCMALVLVLVLLPASVFTAHAAAIHNGAHFLGVINARHANKAKAAEVWPDGNEFIAVLRCTPSTTSGRSTPISLKYVAGLG